VGKDGKPGPREIIAHRQGNQDHKPEKTRSHNDPGKLGTVADVHEKKDDEGSFADGNNQRNYGVEFAQVNEGHLNGDKSQDHQNSKNDEVDLFGYDVLRHGF
jgi:hypothetical protein